MVDRIGDVTISPGNETGTVAVVEIHRPPANYFDEALIDDLATILGNAEADTRLRAAVLCAEGRHFCAGADFAGVTDRPVRSIPALYEHARRLFAISLPVVAAVQGSAIGGGLGLSLACDFRVAGPSSRFAANFARLGLHQGFGISVTLPAVVGTQAALDMLYTGRRVGGDEAYKLGLCDRLVDDDAVRAEAVAFAEEVAASGPLAIRAIKRTVRAEIAAKVGSVLDAEHAAQDILMRTNDFAEGVRAAAERRDPVFTGT